MDEWVIWLIATVALAVGEMVIMGFFLGPFAIGAAVATVVSVADGGTVAAGAVFLVASTGAMVGLRPVVRRHLRTPPSLRTNTAALVGRTATVVDPVTHSGGSVKIDGDLWTARPYDEDDVIEPGTRVHVMEIRGATALVSE